MGAGGSQGTALNSLRSVGDSQSALEGPYMSRAADQQETPEELMQEVFPPSRRSASAQRPRVSGLTPYISCVEEAAQ